MRHIKVTVLNWDAAANPCLGCDNKKHGNLIIISIDLYISLIRLGTGITLCMLITLSHCSFKDSYKSVGKIN